MIRVDSVRLPFRFGSLRFGFGSGRDRSGSDSIPFEVASVLFGSASRLCSGSLRL